MNTKLTLSIGEKTIRKAKKYAKERNVSVSSLIENYLESLTEAEKGEKDITPLVKSLSGVISLPEKFDHRASYKEHLSKKYLND